MKDALGATRTLDLASALEAGTGGARSSGEAQDSKNYNLRSVLTIAFQFTFENHYRDSVATMARQYIRNIVGSVQRVAMAISPSQLSTQLTPKTLPGSPEAVTLARWISRSYRYDRSTLARPAFFKYLFGNQYPIHDLSRVLQGTHWGRTTSGGGGVECW